MAEVFEAELAGELGFARKVAIKRMLAEAARDPRIAQRFLDEARIASRLHHAGIVAVLDVGLLDDLPFQVLELIDGVDLGELASLAGGRLPIEIALAIVGDVAHALDHAHTASDDAGLPFGIVHRDVKPSNVLVSWAGDVKLTDFGIAVARDRDARTEAGVAVGTHGFMAPEQRRKGEVDGRTDVFALALTLHELITGDNPMRDITVETALLAGTPLPLSPELPAELRPLIERAVTPERWMRPSAAELADQVGALLAPRLSRDPRGALRDFLAPFHARPSRAGALDQLLGLDVVLTSPPVSDQPPRYELRPVATEPTIVPPAPPTQVPRGPAIAVAVLAVAAAGGGAAWWRSAHAHVPVPVRDAAVAIAVHADAAHAAPPPIVLDAPLIVADAPIAIDAPRSPSVVVRGSHHHADAGVVVEPPGGTGYLVVGGDDSTIGAKVVLDGHSIGFAPGKLEVPRGHHRVELIRADGTHLPAKDVDVDDYSTLAHPVRVTW